MPFQRAAGSCRCLARIRKRAGEPAFSVCRNAPVFLQRRAGREALPPLRQKKKLCSAQLLTTVKHCNILEGRYEGLRPSGDAGIADIEKVSAIKHNSFIA